MSKSLVNNTQYIKSYIIIAYIMCINLELRIYQNLVDIPIVYYLYKCYYHTCSAKKIFLIGYIPQDGSLDLGTT